MRTVNKCSMHGVYLYWLAHLRMFRSKAPVIRERFAEIVIRASVLAGVPLMFKLLNHCASVNVRLGLHVAEMLQLPRLFSCAKCTFPAFCGIIRGDCGRDAAVVTIVFLTQIALLRVLCPV